MKRLSKVLIGIGVFLLAQAMSMGLAESTQTVVTGTNDPANDVKAVQDAVDKGGEILLKGTFHFGDKGSGIIKRDVKILGEKSSEGIPATKIRGGFRTLLSPLPVQLPPETPGPRISIQNIHFDESNMSPIFIAYSSGANISGNKITNVRPLAASPQMNFSVGVIVGTNMIQPAATRKYQPGAVTGSITIADNDLDMSNDTPQKTLGQGIFVHWTTGITLQILANRVKNCSRNSIEAVDNYLGDDGTGSVVIRENDVTTPTVGAPFPSPRTPNGILVAWFFDGTGAGASNPKQNMKHTIINNTVRARGETSMAMWIGTNEVLVENNHITTEQTSANGIFVNGAQCHILKNKIEGVGTAAIVISPHKSLTNLTGSNNRCENNDIGSFKASVADISLEQDSKGNVVIGSSGKAKDLGTDN
jgi:hypothetical protein